MKKHFVEFFSPGTLVAESSLLPIDNWDVEKAMKMADTITERHGATPYGFQFVTKAREDDELDSKIVKRSKTYYLGGKVFTLAEIKKKNDPDDRILISNMEGNHYPAVIINTNSWKWTQPFEKGDVLLDYTPPKRVSQTTK